jgi:hypothetical protein
MGEWGRGSGERGAMGRERGHGQGSGAGAGLQQCRAADFALHARLQTTRRFSRMPKMMLVRLWKMGHDREHDRQLVLQLVAPGLIAHRLPMDRRSCYDVRRLRALSRREHGPFSSIKRPPANHGREEALWHCSSRTIVLAANSGHHPPSPNAWSAIGRLISARELDRRSTSALVVKPHVRRSNPMVWGHGRVTGGPDRLPPARPTIFAFDGRFRGQPHRLRHWLLSRRP